MYKNDWSLRSCLNSEVNIPFLQIRECMVCCCVVQISGESFSVFCYQKLYEYLCHRRKGSISRRAGAKCPGKHAISLTELHAGYLLKRQVQWRVWLWDFIWRLLCTVHSGRATVTSSWISLYTVGCNWVSQQYIATRCDHAWKLFYFCEILM